MADLEAAGFIYRCPGCGSTKRVDFAARTFHAHPLDGRPSTTALTVYEREGLLYREPPREWAPTCCGKPMQGKPIAARPGKLKACGARCTSATGVSCSCPCGGANHGADFRA